MTTALRTLAGVLAAAALAAGAWAWLGGEAPADPRGGAAARAGTREPAAIDAAPAGRAAVAPAERTGGGATAIPAAAPPTTGTVTARVVDAHGAPIAGATASFVRRDANPLAHDVAATAAADGAGHVRVELPATEYRLTVAADGFRRHGPRAPIAVVAGATTDLGDVVLAAGAALTGEVLGPDGAPVAAALVTVRPAVDPSWADSAHGGEDGAFAFHHLPLGRAAVEVRAQGFALWRDEDVVVAPGAHLVVRLERGDALRLTVLDAATGAPVERFAARARRASSPRAAERPLREPTDAGPVRDHAGGVLELRGLDPGRWVVDVVAPGYRHERTPPQAAGDGPVTVLLQRGATVAGVVAGPDGAPVAEATVQLRAADEPDRPIVLLTHTGAAGAFRFDNAPPVRLVVTVRARGFAITDTPPFAPGAGRDDLRIVLGAPAALHGTVRGARAGEDLRVLAFADVATMRTGRVGADGRYRIDGLQPGAYLVRAFAGPTRRYLARRLGPAMRGERTVSPDVVLRHGQEVELDVAVDRPPLGELRGSALANGLPAAGFVATLHDLAAAGPRAWSLELRGVAGADGRFAIGEVPAAEYELRLTAPGGAVIHREPVIVVAERAAEVAIAVATGAVDGTVTAADAAADELDGEVVARGAGTDLVVRTELIDGRFRIAHLPAGDYALEVRIAGRAPAGRDVRVTAGQPTAVEVAAGASRR